MTTVNDVLKKTEEIRELEQKRKLFNSLNTEAMKLKCRELDEILRDLVDTPPELTPASNEAPEPETQKKEKPEPRKEEAPKPQLPPKKKRPGRPAYPEGSYSMTEESNERNLGFAPSYEVLAGKSWAQVEFEDIKKGDRLRLKGRSGKVSGDLTVVATGADKTGNKKIVVKEV